MRDARTGKIVRTVDGSGIINAVYGNFEELRGGTLSNDGKILALTTWTSPNINDKKFPSIGKLRLWNLENHKPICIIKTTEFPRSLKPGDYYIAPAIRAVRFAPNDQTVAVGLDDGSVSLWDVRSGQLKHRLEGQKNPVVALAFSPDGKTLASGSADDMLYGEREQSDFVIWDVNRGRLLRRFGTGRTTALAFSPGGKTLASGDDAGGAALWNLTTGTLVRRLDGHS